jgi:hypothetical protein
MQIRILLLIKVIDLCDYWSADLPALPYESPSLHREVYGPSRLHIVLLTSMWIRIQLFHLMRIQIQLPKLMWIRMNPGPQTGFFRCIKYRTTPVDTLP